MDGTKDSNQSGFKYVADDPSNNQQPVAMNSQAAPKESDPLLEWSAPDSFSVQKSAVWYLILILVFGGIAALIYFLTRDKITTAVIIFCGLLFGIYAAKKPRMIHYRLTKSGFSVNGREYNFGSYRSFSLIYNGDGGSVVLTPLKRFMPYMYIYFDRQSEPKITAALLDVLPKENAHNDPIDKMLRKIGF